MSLYFLRVGEVMPAVERAQKSVKLQLAIAQVFILYADFDDNEACCMVCPIDVFQSILLVINRNQGAFC